MYSMLALEKESSAKKRIGSLLRDRECFDAKLKRLEIEGPNTAVCSRSNLRLHRIVSGSERELSPAWLESLI
jgi:hypothetical protein